MDGSNEKRKKPGVPANGKGAPAKDKKAFPGYIKYVLPGVLVIAAAVAAYFIYGAYSGGYVATVGNEKISKAEFSFYLKTVKDGIISSVRNADPNTFWSTKIDGENALEVAKKKALDYAKEAKVQLIKAKEAKTVLSKEAQGYIDNYEKQMNDQLKSSGETAESYVQKTYGMPMSDFKTIMKESFIISTFKTNELNGMKTVSIDDLKKYYAKYPDTFKNSDYRSNGEEAVWARHILISTKDKDGKDLPQDKQDEAKKKAEDLLKRAKTGEDFVKLAKENSEDPGSAGTGGDYVFGKGQMQPEFEKAAFELNAGQVSGLVKTAYGYHIIKLEEKIPQGQPVSLKCATEYREYGLNAVKACVYQDRLNDWKTLYKITINQSVYNSIK